MHGTYHSAFVICFAGSAPHYYSSFGRGSVPLMVADLFCTGSEASILECNRNDYGILHCSPFEVAGVECEGEHFSLIYYFKQPVHSHDNLSMCALIHQISA